MAEALAHQMFKESYSTLAADQKAKVDAAIRKNEFHREVFLSIVDC
jgi:hypothetical protein